VSVRLGEKGEAWKWRWGLFAWEEKLVGELCLLLQNVTLQVDKEDMWLWNLESSNDFTIRSAYKVMVHQHHTDTFYEGSMALGYSSEDRSFRLASVP
jgi:hypothetical protein